MIKRLFTIIVLAFLFFGVVSSYAQHYDDVDADKEEKEAIYIINVEAQASASKGKTPLWMNANKYGLSSLDEMNGYVRGSVLRNMKPFDSEDETPFDYSFGVDIAAAYGYTSTLVIQQAFAEARWLRGKVTLGSKNYEMELRDNNLSSGSQTLGKNARPVPQLRLALDEYWPIPGTKGFLNLKGHIAYGMMTDYKWQKEFTNEETKHVKGGLYHSKAGYLKLGKEEAPVHFTAGMEMVTMFGGTSYKVIEGDNLVTIENASDIKAFWNAFLPTSSSGENHAAEANNQKNVSGNMLGSWLARLDYKTDLWNLGLYFDHFFEDHSQMFFLGSSGYGVGEDYNTKQARHFFAYKLKDMMLGVDWKAHVQSWLDSFVFEYIYTKYQSGPIYHDHSQTIADHIGGDDNYYNNYIQTPYQHWGQVMGNPLYLSPIYNDDGTLEVKNNRFVAYHLGVGGHPTEDLSYRVLMSFQDGMGTYRYPYENYKKSFNFLAEATYEFPKHWQATLALGLDRGNIHGNNTGAQLTVRKTIFK